MQSEVAPVEIFPPGVETVAVAGSSVPTSVPVLSPAAGWLILVVGIGIIRWIYTTSQQFGRDHPELVDQIWQIFGFLYAGVILFGLGAIGFLVISNPDNPIMRFASGLGTVAGAITGCIGIARYNKKDTPAPAPAPGATPTHSVIAPGSRLAGFGGPWVVSSIDATNVVLRSETNVLGVPRTMGRIAFDDELRSGSLKPL